jgi:hypothetical protein
MSDTKYTDAPDDMLSLLKSEFLCAADLDGRDWPVTIRGVKVAHLEKNAVVQQAATKGAVGFTDGPECGGARKPMLINTTNTRTIVKLYGKNPKAWIGKRITLYPTTVQMKGETKDCIRVRPTAPPMAATPPSHAAHAAATSSPAGAGNSPKREPGEEG